MLYKYDYINTGEYVLKEIDIIEILGNNIYRIKPYNHIVDIHVNEVVWASKEISFTSLYAGTKELAKEIIILKLEFEQQWLDDKFAALERVE